MIIICDDDDDVLILEVVSGDNTYSQPSHIKYKLRKRHKHIYRYTNKSIDRYIDADKYIYIHIHIYHIPT